METVVFWTILGVGAFLFLYFAVAKPLRRAIRRKAILLSPFPKEWEEILNKNVPLYGRLPPDLREQLHRHIQVFVGEKNFEGCGGLKMTDEIRVTIAAQACFLLLNRKTRYYPKLVSILVYPHAYVAKGRDGGGVMNEDEVRLGESWHGGMVVLAWDHVKHGAWDIKDGHNVVFHEFAHQLDQEDGAGDGAPILPQRSMYSAWARVLGREFQLLRQQKRRGKKSDLDKYGAGEPAEFFAVATEAFFEKPRQMKEKHAELYEELKLYYQTDPVSWRQ